MIKTKHYIFIFFLSILIIGWRIPGTKANYNSPAGDSKAFQRNKNIGRGINFGNALEAPSEGAWGLTIKESYIQTITFDNIEAGIRYVVHQ